MSAQIYWPDRIPKLWGQNLHLTPQECSNTDISLDRFGFWSHLWRKWSNLSAEPHVLLRLLCKELFFPEQKSSKEVKVEEENDFVYKTLKREVREYGKM